MKKSILPLAIILLSTLLAFSLLTKDHEWGDDWASYLMQSIAITKGETHEFIQRNTFTMRESTHFIGPDAYPWGYPTLLAPFTLACGPLNILCLKFINPILFALFLWVFYALLARRLPPLESALVPAIFAFSPLLLKFTDQIGSDIAFLFFSTLALLLIDNVGRIANPTYSALHVDNVGRIGNPTYNILLGLALFFAFFIRTNWILLLPTLFLAQAFHYLQTTPRVFPDWKRILYNEAIPYDVFDLLTFLNRIIFPSRKGTHH